MARRRLAGARLWRQRVDAHAQHERSDMTSAHSDALPVQLVAQHARAHERVLQMQFIDPA